MADFSPACQAARNAYQATMNAYIAARDAHQQTGITLRQATDALNDAQRELVDAQNAKNAADAAWDAHVAAIKNDPSLGVANVEAGILPPDAAPGGAAIAGLIQSRIAPNFSIWAAGSDADRSTWHGVATGVLQQAADLESAAQKAQDALDAKAAQHAAAAAAEAVARAAEQAARATRSAASEAASAERARVTAACAGEKASHPIGGGGEVEVAPGVLPEDEEEVRNRLDKLPDLETKGIKKVELGDDVKKDADTGETEWTAGHYVVGQQTIYLFVLGHSEQTLKHEVGHHVYFHRLSDAARTRWKQFFEQGTNGETVPSGKMPTQYASTDEVEGFAEAYEFLRDNKPLDPEVKQLLEDLLGDLH